MRSGAAASIRLFPAILWLFYLLLIPIHLYSHEHFCGSLESIAHHSDSDNHHHQPHHSHNRHGHDQHTPHYAADHGLKFTLQKSMPIVKIDVVVNSITPGFLAASEYKPAIPVPIDSIPISGAPPTLQESRAPPAI